MCCLASIALFWAPLHQLVSLSLDDRRYSHLILIPVIAAFFLYRERHAIFSRIAFHSAALPFLVAALAIYALLALRILHPSADYALSALMLAVVLVWITLFAVFYGAPAFKAALFPLLFLLLLVPVPFNLMDKIIATLQWGSSEATYVLFKLVGVPVFKDGVRFELPVVGIEVAKECSSIHSAWALFITALLLAHLFLRSIWTKTCLCILAIPVAMFTNAIRIVTIWFLGTKVDIGFLEGNLHRNGGILFSLISLSVLLLFLALFRKLDLRKAQALDLAAEQRN